MSVLTAQPTQTELPFAQIDQIVSAADGSPWIAEDHTQGRAQSAQATYGELTASGAQALLQYLDPTSNDVFCDIGSGAGRLVLQIAAAARLRRCLGVEFIQSRHDISVRALHQAQADLQTADVEFVYGDALNMEFESVTMAFLCATCFSDDFMAQIARQLVRCDSPMTLVSLARFPEETPGFFEIDEFTLDATWASEVTAHAYLVLGDAA